jgi:hypothetical protein
MAMERSVVATSVGGPSEFVTPEAGVLVDPSAVDALTAALDRATTLASPNAAGRLAASEHDVARQAARMDRGHFRVLRESGVIEQTPEGTARVNRLRRDDLEARFPGLLASVLNSAPAPARSSG